MNTLLLQYAVEVEKTGSIPHAFSRFVGNPDKNSGISVWLKETNSLNTIKDLEYKPVYGSGRRNVQLLFTSRLIPEL